MAAATLRVSVSSIKRWQREFGRQTNGQADVDLDVNIITDILDESRDKRLIALLRFVCWLRWPCHKDERSIAFLTCLAAYVEQKKLASSLANGSCPVCIVLREEFDISILSQLLRGHAASPNFDLTKYFDTDYDEIDLYVDVVEYILAHKNEASLIKSSPSLNKAAFLINKGEMRTFISPRTFWIYWSEMAAAAPFWYVARKHSDLRWDIDPNSIDFASSIDLLVDQRDGLMKFLSWCRWAVDEITYAMHKNAKVYGRFPAFPAGIKSAPLPIPPLSASRRQLLSEYRA